MILTKKD